LDAGVVGDGQGFVVAAGFFALRTTDREERGKKGDS
jgi:hypothetical protein